MRITWEGSFWWKASYSPIGLLSSNIIYLLDSFWCLFQGWWSDSFESAHLNFRIFQIPLGDWERFMNAQLVLCKSINQKQNLLQQVRTHQKAFNQACKLLPAPYWLRYLYPLLLSKPTIEIDPLLTCCQLFAHKPPVFLLRLHARPNQPNVPFMRYSSEYPRVAKRPEQWSKMVKSDHRRTVGQLLIFISFCTTISSICSCIAFQWPRVGHLSCKLLHSKRDNPYKQCDQ